MDSWLIDLDTQLTWTVLGRVPAALVLVALTLSARKVMGVTSAALGLSAFCAGAVVGTALLPSILGALGGGVLAALLTWRSLGAAIPGPAPLVLSSLALLLVGRIGCLLAGCCFGQVSDAAWAVQYPVGSFAQSLHSELHLVGANEASLPVLPVQLFEALGVMVIFAGALALRRALRRDGPWALFTVAGYLLLRSAIDPLRGMVNTAASLQRVGPASAFQWAAAAAAVALVVTGIAWLRRPRRSSRGPASASQRPLPGRAAFLWAVQAAATIAAQHEGTWLLRVFAVASLAASAGCLIHQLGQGQRRRAVAFAAASAALLLPAGLFAADGPIDEAQPRWLYAAIPGSGHLVRLGTRATSGPELTRRYLAFLQQEEPQPQGAEPSPEQVDAGYPHALDAGSPALPPPPPPLPPPAADALEVGLVVLAGQQQYESPGCNGYSAQQKFGRVGVTATGRIGANGRWQARASLLINESRISDPAGHNIDLRSQVGAFGTAGGLVEYEGQYASIGIGLVVGLGNLGHFAPWISGAPYPNNGFPSAAPDGVRGSAVPLIYVRLEAIRGWAFELGTGSRFQPAEGPFVGFRFGHDDPGQLAFRLGAETVWFPYPLANLNFFGDLAIPVTPRSRFSLRLLFLPPSAAGGVRFVHSF